MKECTTPNYQPVLDDIRNESQGAKTGNITKKHTYMLSLCCCLSSQFMECIEGLTASEFVRTSLKEEDKPVQTGRGSSLTDT